jgi:hypothetical protein
MNQKKPVSGKKDRLPMQTVSLSMALLAPFALFWALENNLSILAALCFGLIALSMGLVILKG